MKQKRLMVTFNDSQWRAIRDEAHLFDIPMASVVRMRFAEYLAYRKPTPSVQEEPPILIGEDMIIPPEAPAEAPR